MMLPPEGHDMTEAGAESLRLALTAGDWDWLPEIAGLKHPGKEFGNWRELCGTFDPRRRYRNRFGPLLNTALYCNGLFVFDCDVDDPDVAEGLLDPMATILGTPRCLRYRRGSTRMAWVYAAIDGDGVYRSLRGSDGGIEVLTGPQRKLTAFGIHRHRETGVRTRLMWEEVPGNVRKADLTGVTVEQREAFLRAAADWLGDDVVDYSHDPNAPHPARQSRNGANLDSLLAALHYIPNTRYDWRGWNTLGMALYAATDGDEQALQGWIEWTRTGGYPDAEDRCTARWDDYYGSPPQRIGAGTVFWLARKNGYRPPPPTAAERQQQKIYGWQPSI